MQTSCGSPCYAAPELVISDGMYVGSAVDVWSCGVILYAMLAGYLPFDDDPANPDGDNINLLYKYIVNTPLSFPDYISAEARDLLSLMLVPDPRHRADLSQVMNHHWLQPYAHLFSRGVGELEHAAMEQHQAKRLAYQRQMKAAAAAEAQQKMSRTQSARADGYANTVNVVPSSRSRSHRDYSQPQQQEYLYETSVDQSIYLPPTPAAAATNPRRGFNSQIVLSPTSNLMVDDDPFAPTQSKEKLTSLVTASPIDEVLREGDVRGEAKVKNDREEVTSETPRNPAINGSVAVPVKTSPDAKKKKDGFRHTIQVEYGQDDENQHPQATSNDFTTDTERTEVRANGTGRTSISSPAHERTARKLSADIQISPLKALPPTPVTPDSVTRRRTASKSSTKPTPVSPDSQSANVAVEIISPSPAVNVEDRSAHYRSNSNGTQSKHRKGLSMDKIGFGKIFGVGTEQQPPHANGAVTNGSSRLHYDSDANANGGSVKRPSTLQVTPSQFSTVSGASTKSSLLSPFAPSTVSNSSSKKNRRNTLTVMVEPFSRPMKQKTKGKVDASAEETQIDKVATSEPPTKTAISFLPMAKLEDISRSSVGVRPGNAASTSKARKVMDWFRTKSKGKVPSEDVPVVSEKELPSADATAGSSSTTIDNGARAAKTPSQISVSEEPTSKPIDLPTPRHSQRTSSVATDRSITNIVKRTMAPSPGPKNVLRIHHGAVDQTTITSGSPPEVMKHVLGVLESMGLEVQEESQYKYRCIRPKKRKIGSTGLGLNLRDVAGSSHGLTAFAMVGSAASGGVSDFSC
jgi:protein-serine/threonine kinase